MTITPLVMAQFRRPVAPPTVPDKMPSRQEVQGIAIKPVTDLTPGKIVRPTGKRTVLVVQVDDGIRKAKQVKPGMRVRPYLNGEARGGERTVLSVERINEGALVRIAFSSGHPTQEYKPAYRFVDLDAVGREVQVRQSAPSVFVEVSK